MTDRILPNLFLHLKALGGEGGEKELDLDANVIHNVRTPPRKGFTIVTLTKPEHLCTLKAAISLHYPSNLLSLDPILKSYGSQLHPKRLDVPDGERGVKFNWDVERRGGEKNKNGKRKGEEGGGGDDKGKKGKGEDGRGVVRKGPLTPDEVRDKLTPLWREYLQKVDPKAKERVEEEQQRFHLYKKTIAAKKECLVKVVKGVRSTYQDRIESRNREIKKLRQRKPEELERMAEDDKDRVFGAVQGYPGWTDKKANAVEWCKGEKGILGGGRILGYRNKCELTIKGPSKDDGKKGSQGVPDDQQHDGGNIVKVGFLPQGWNGDTAEPRDCYNVPEVMADVGRELGRLVKARAYDPSSYKGVWRMVTVRVGRRGGEREGGRYSVQVVMQHATEKGVDGKGVGGEEWRKFKDDKEIIKKAWEGKVWVTDDRERVKEVEKLGGERNIVGVGREEFEITSCLLQGFDGVSTPPPEHPVEVLFGEKEIEYELCGCTFKVSHGAFFQVNTGCAELLYERIVKEVDLGKKEGERTVMFDVCCGTGSIGIVAAKIGAVDKVVGCDISVPAIRDAEVNKVLNGLGKRCVFEAGRAEEVMMGQVKREMDATGDEGGTTRFIAVVDPAREGCHGDVLKAIRNTKAIKRVVYVSCNPTVSLPRDARVLCGPTSNKVYGGAFRVRKAQPVDMFPLTKHTEVIMVFDRGEGGDEGKGGGEGGGKGETRS